MKHFMMTIAALLCCIFASAQVYDSKGVQIDTTGIYGERTDSLQAAVSVGRQSGNYLSKGKDIRTEVISSAGLRKLACCSLADSFENSASVTVGYSDATTGARQIRLLGLSGSYVQMLDEARPTMRGIAAPFGLNYIPGSWMESIQIAKGATSVVSGSEAMTGSINIEHKKPTDEKPFFLNGSIMNDTKADLNMISSLQLNEDWSTIILAHVSGNFKAMDHNGDGFVDDPKQLQFNFANRWLYFTQNETAIRFGIKAVRDTRQGGELHGENSTDQYGLTVAPWKSNVLNQSISGYLKIGKPVGEVGSIALVADYSYQDLDSDFGNKILNPDVVLGGNFTTYHAKQHSGYVNFMYQDEINDRNKFTMGLSTTMDFYDENMTGPLGIFTNGDRYLKDKSNLASGGIYGEYTYHNEDKFSAILGIRADAYSGHGAKVTPRLTLRYSPSESFTFRANGGRGLRYSSPIIDNLGVLSTNKYFQGDYKTHTLEDSWIMGGNATWYFNGSSANYLSLDYFHSLFKEQKLIDYGYANWNGYDIYFYNLSSVDGGKAYSDNIQADLALEPFERFTVSTTFRYTKSMMSHWSGTLMEKPMTSRYKGVLNLQYATNLNKWIFDATASINGPCNVWNFMRDIKDDDGTLLYKDGKTPVYPLFYLQVTRRFKGWDVYLGGENLGGFTQKNVIISPNEHNFDASQVWGPIMGAKIYAGFRFTVWKTK